MNIMKEFLKLNHLRVLLLGLVGAGLLAFMGLSPIKAQINLGDNPNFDPYGPGIKVIIVAPPDVFTLPGSETTNFTRVCTLGEALNIVLDVAGKNKIEFGEPIVDMCDNKTMENLDQYIQLDKVGEVTVRSDALPYLEDKSAKITMRNLPFEEEPGVEIDGRPATNQDIEDKTWNQSSKTLTFQAKHFTTYKAVARATSPLIQEKESTGEQQPPSSRYDYRTTYPRDVYTLSPIYVFLIIFVAVIVLLIIVGALYFIWRKRKR